VSNFVPIGQTVDEIMAVFLFFQNGGRPPSWISSTPAFDHSQKSSWFLSLYKCGKWPNSYPCYRTTVPAV